MIDKLFYDRLVSGKIDPSLGLLLAELQVSHFVDKELNIIVQRHSDWYYRDYLKIESNPSIDEALILGVDVGEKDVKFPHDSQFEANIEDQDPEYFAIQNPTHIHPIELSKVGSLIYQTDPDVSYHAATGGVTGVKACIGNPKDFSTQPLFELGQELHLNLGFDLYSPILFLSEGEREISFDLVLERPSGLVASNDPKQEPQFDELILELQGDPELVSAFSDLDEDGGAAHLAEQISQSAREENRGISLSFLYEWLLRRINSLEAMKLLIIRIVSFSLIEDKNFFTTEVKNLLKQKLNEWHTELIGLYRLRSNEINEEESFFLDAFFQLIDSSNSRSHHSDIFDLFLNQSFDITFSSEEKRLKPKSTRILPKSTAGAGGITLFCTVSADQAPITPFADGKSVFPHVSVRMGRVHNFAQFLYLIAIKSPK